MKYLRSKKLFSFVILTFFCSFTIAMPFSVKSRCDKNLQEARDLVRRFDIKKSTRMYESYLKENIKIQSSDVQILRVHLDMARPSIINNFCELFLTIDNDFASISPIAKEVAGDYAEETLSLIEKYTPQLNSIIISFLNGDLLPRDFEEQEKLLRKNSYGKELDEETKKFFGAIDDITNGKRPTYGKSMVRRELAKKDPIAQVLNYASGVPEDATGIAYFYPENTENGQCIYKMAISSSTATGSIANDVMSGLLEANKIISAAGITAANDSVAVLEKGIDLNQGNLKDINFFKVQGAKQNKFTGKTAYLRYQSRIEGLPDIFECDSSTCNIDRLRRGWSLVTSSCKGVQKPF